MTLHVFPTAAETARALIGHILQLLGDSDRQEFNIALSGGSTPALMFDLWAAEFSEATPWERICFYWVDERCVGPEDAESNYGMTRRHLFEKVSVQAEHVFRIEGEADPEAESRRYASLVARQVPVADGFPVFDLVLLGAGDDGHTSSIFPGQEHLLTTAQAYAVGTHPATGQKRVALTGEPIVRAARLVFLMTGGKKAPVLKAMSDASDSGPAAYVAHHARHAVEVFADEAAAGRS